jgi:hypothetical protein
VLVAGGAARLETPGPEPTVEGSNRRRPTARGATRPEAMSNRWPPGGALATLVLRPALRSRPNTRSCGNQPAHFSLDHASRNDTLTSTSIPHGPPRSPFPHSRNTMTSPSPPSRPSPSGVGPYGPALTSASRATSNQ